MTTYVPEWEIFEETLSNLLCSGKSVSEVRSKIREVKRRAGRERNAAKRPDFMPPCVSYIPAYGAESTIEAMQAYCSLRQLSNNSELFARWFARLASAPMRSRYDGLICNCAPYPQYREEPNEEYMNPRQREHFRQLLLEWKRQASVEVRWLRKQAFVYQRLIKERAPLSELETLLDQDAASRAELDSSNDTNICPYESRLMGKIDDALARIANGKYGYCLESGKPIGLARLAQHPLQLYCVEVEEQKRLERHTSPP